MASKDIVEEEMELSGDSTVEYLGSSMEYESDGSCELSSQAPKGIVMIPMVRLLMVLVLRKL